MRFATVCSGIGAEAIAARALGWEPVGFVERSAFPSAVLAHRFPGVCNYGDLTTLEPAELIRAAPTVLFGGTPCQGFSVGGFRRGLDDDRSNLARDFLGLARDLRPRWIVWENVPGALSTNGGRDFGALLGGLEVLGYGFAWRVLDARGFALPQQRARLFLVAHPGGWQGPAAVLLERRALESPGRPLPTPGPDSPDALPRGARVFRKSRRARTAEDFETWLEDGTANTLTAFDAGKARTTHLALDAKGARILTPLELERLMGFPDGWTAVPYRDRALEALDWTRSAALGNSIAVPVVRWIVERIQKVDDLVAPPT